MSLERLNGGASGWAFVSGHVADEAKSLSAPAVADTGSERPCLFGGGSKSLFRERCPTLSFRKDLKPGGITPRPVDDPLHLVNSPPLLGEPLLSLRRFAQR